MTDDDYEAMAEGAHDDYQTMKLEYQHKEEIDELKGKITALEHLVEFSPTIEKTATLYAKIACLERAVTGERWTRIELLEEAIKFALDYAALPMHIRKKLDKALNPKPKPKRTRKRGASHDRPK